MEKVVLITGASSGIGMNAAIYLAQKGMKVYAAARRIERLESLKQYGIIPIQMDITKEEDRLNAVNLILGTEGRIDVLFNNAGFGLFGPLEDISIEDAKYQFDVNLFSLARLTQMVLPYMRNQKSGRIINTSSIGGKITSLLGGWYHASKFALEAYSDCLRLEVKQYGIKVVLIEPGLIKSEFAQKTYQNAKKFENSPYSNLLERVKNQAENDYIKRHVGSDPIVVSKVLFKAITHKKPKTRYLCGKLSKTAVFARWILPDKVLDWILLKR